MPPAKFGKPRRDIIPHDFFLDLYNEVDDLLVQNVGKAPEPELNDAVNDSFLSKASRKPKTASRSSPGKVSSPWATHAFFEAPLFTEESAPTPTSTRFAPDETQELVKAADPLKGSGGPFQEKKQHSAKDSADYDKSLRQRAVMEGQLRGQVVQEESAGLMSLEVQEDSPPTSDGPDRTRGRAAASMERACPKAVVDVALSSKAPAQAASTEQRQAQQQPQEAGHRGSATLDVTQLLGGADGEIAICEAEAVSPTSNATTLKSKEKPKRPPVHKYEFREGERFTDVKAASHIEALERLRQFLLMKYGSYRRAWVTLEESTDMSGLMGYREDDAMHVSGMLQYREFQNAIAHLVPNWAEISGCGSLAKLFKAIDDNDSGYMSFEELMGCKAEDEMASATYDSCRNRPMQHCPFRRSKSAPAMWNQSQTRTGPLGETFHATQRHRDLDAVTKSLAPKFTPIFEMEHHHHEEDDGDSSMSSDAHSSEQELDLEHIKLRIRAAGLNANVNWRKLFVHYDQSQKKEVGWWQFRSIVRKEAEITPDMLTERDLKELFFRLQPADVCQTARNAFIHYENLLEFLEPKPTKEELAELKKEGKATIRHCHNRHFHKTPHLRQLEMERRHVAANHHEHMSCNPCTKLCEICQRIILVSSWAAHKHGCTRKAERIVQKEKDEIAWMAQWSFKPKLSKKAKAAKGTGMSQAGSPGTEATGRYGKVQVDESRFPIRARRNQEKAAEHHERNNGDLIFSPRIDRRSRDIHRLVHADIQQDIGTRLHCHSPRGKFCMKQDHNEAEEEHTHMPAITVLAIQKGLQHGAENVFHRLYHGTREVSCLVDPGTEKDEYETVQHVTKRLMMSRQPMGISEKNWSKVKKTQQQNCEAMLANRRVEELAAGISPSVASGFLPDQYQVVGGTPSSVDLFSGSQELASPMMMSAPHSSRSNNFSVAGQPPFSARTVSSQATRAEMGSARTTPGAVDPTGKIRVQKAIHQVMSSKARAHPRPASSKARVHPRPARSKRHRRKPLSGVSHVGLQQRRLRSPGLRISWKAHRRFWRCWSVAIRS